MRLDLPYEPELPRRRDIEPPTNPSEINSPGLPVSFVQENIDRLQRPAGEQRVPRMERERTAQPEPTARSREPERRPRRTREGVAVEVRGIRLRSEEQQILREAGRFRVVALKDVAQTIYGGNDHAMRTDLDYLHKHSLISIDSVAPRNDGRWLERPRIEVVTLTKDGERLAHETGGVVSGQRLYHGLVKPREAEHDSQVYRAYLKEAEGIEKAGCSNLRVELDFELKSKVQKAIRVAQKADPERSMDEIKREVAQHLELPLVRDKIEIPDARIHYELNQGSRASFSDVEVVTAAYRPGHMQAKAQAGFRMYASASDHSRLSKVEDEQHMLDWVMDL
jgi:hypothetical protein